MVDIKPYVATLLRVLYSAVLEEKSSAAKRAFASSCAAVIKYASPSQAQKLIEDTASLHLGEKNAQLCAAVLVKAYLSNAADVLGGYNAVVIPVIFASRFDDDKDISALYGELWEDIPSSERVTLQLYLPEIVSLLCDCMSSSSWAGKRKSAKAIKKLCDALGESLSVHHNNILKSLLKELPGRFWEVITAFKDPGFFNIVFPMLYEVSNRSVICKTRGSSSLAASSSTGQLSISTPHCIPTNAYVG
uniref:Proteasome adapter and scaffold protein ECM29 HEAT-repeat domain-containing protein n=1 Tax=Leersia perrieri TaxID=77586 RepID=A0A0D9XWN5_9ORYZ